MLSTPISDFLWPKLADTRAAKMAWRLFREFQDTSDFAEEFGSSVLPAFVWRVDDRIGSVQDRAIKFGLLRARNDEPEQRCETVVLFPKHPAQRSKHRRSPRATACVSAQPGCGVGCPFCSTGELGYRGNLTADEIVEQVYWAGSEARREGYRLRNVVYMGMGEPLHNTQAVLESLNLLTDERLFGLRPRHITVSTAGVPRSMLKLADAFPDVRIALSLHSGLADQRKSLVPRATNNLEYLKQTIARINQIQEPTPLWLEVVLFAGLNDSSQHANAIIDFAAGLNVEVNLIPYNPAAGNNVFRTADRESREQFATSLQRAGIRTRIRTSFGEGQAAACGQLTTAR